MNSFSENVVSFMSRFLREDASSRVIWRLCIIGEGYGR